MQKILHKYLLTYIFETMCNSLFVKPRAHVTYTGLLQINRRAFSDILESIKNRLLRDMSLEREKFKKRACVRYASKNNRKFLALPFQRF